jgi:ABC-type sugar transport system ATPase subunit
VTAAGLDVRVEDITRHFGETRALSEVSLSVRPGSVHALVGENGAGKSTLGRIISGVIRPDSGRILIDGTPVAFGTPHDALDAGVATIAQELALVPALSAVENVLLGIESSRLGVVRRAEMVVRYRELAERAGFDIPPKRPVGSLPIAQQQQVEILRALSRDARLIVMDEPTARLSGQETVKLHELIGRLKASGRSVLLISHFLAEVLAVADEVTVLRDGRTVRTSPTTEETEESLVEAMLGRAAGAQFPERRFADTAAATAPVLRASDLSGPGFVEASLDLWPGEIVGLSGLVGAGRSELGRVLAGAARASAGSLQVGGVPVHFRSPRDGRRAGVFMLPESRRDQGLFFLRPVRENVSVGSLSMFSRLGFVDRGAESRATSQVLERATVSAPDGLPASSLSGGNQQKLLFARALLAQPKVLIADEPTRGVDVGAKRQIYELLAGLALEGMAILLISSEMEEVLGMSHRVLVMRAGRLVADLRGTDVSEAAILRAIFGAAGAAGAAGATGAAGASA